VIRVDFLGHAAFSITRSDGLVILIDPYESGGFSGRVGYAPIDVVPDIVLITHDHLDHNHTAGLPGEFDVIRHDGESNGVRVRSVRAFHDEFEGTRFGGTVDMKVFEIDGVTFCHAGDLGERLSPAHLEALGPIDVWIPPVGGFYTLDGDKAAETTLALGPRVAIPCHFKTNRCGFDIAPPDAFVAHFDHVQRPGGSVFEVSRETLPDPVTCVVLEPRL